MKMKLLKDIIMYAIKVDYFMWNDVTNEEYTMPHYLCIDTETKNKKGECMNLLIFKEEINSDLRVFDTLKEAKEYLNEKVKGSFCYNNERVIKITYNFETNRWEEC